DPGRRAFLQQLQQQTRQKKITQMVYRERALQTVFSERTLAQNNSGIVHEYVEPLIATIEFVGEFADRVLRSQVAKHKLDTIVAGLLFYVLLGCFTSLSIATKHHDAGAKLRESQGSFLTDAGVSSGDDAQLAGHINVHQAVH